MAAESQPEFTMEVSRETRKANGVTYEVFNTKIPDVELGCQKIDLATFLTMLENTIVVKEQEDEPPKEKKKRRQNEETKEEELRRFKETDVILIDSKNFPGSSEAYFGRNAEAVCVPSLTLNIWRALEKEERPTLLWVFDVRTKVGWTAEVLARWSRLKWMREVLMEADGCSKQLLTGENYIILNRDGNLAEEGSRVPFWLKGQNRLIMRNGMQERRKHNQEKGKNDNEAGG